MLFDRGQTSKMPVFVRDGIMSTEAAMGRLEAYIQTYLRRIDCRDWWLRIMLEGDLSILISTTGSCVHSTSPSSIAASKIHYPQAEGLRLECEAQPARWLRNSHVRIARRAPRADLFFEHKQGSRASPISRPSSDIDSAAAEPHLRDSIAEADMAGKPSSSSSRRPLCRPPVHRPPTRRRNPKSSG